MSFYISEIEGIKRIEGSYTMFIDSDLEYQPQDLYEMYYVVLKNQNIDVLYGSRNLGAKTQLRRYFLNGIAVKINTWIYNFNIFRFFKVRFYFFIFSYFFVL